MDPDIKLCSQLCDIAYDQGVTAAYVQSQGLQVKHVVDSVAGNSVSFSCDCNGRLFVAWRGTETFVNLVEDIQIEETPLIIGGREYGRVHAGMMWYYRDIKDLVLTQVRQSIDEYNHKQIVFTGHSLGACVCYAALECAIMYPGLDVKVVTFASPLLGNAVFASSFDANVHTSIRVVLDADPVPRLKYDADFVHVREEYLIVTGVTFSWTNLVTDVLKAIIRQPGKDNLAKYHYLTSYMNFLSEQLSVSKC